MTGSGCIAIMGGSKIIVSDDIVFDFTHEFSMDPAGSRALLDIKFDWRAKPL